MITWHVSFDPDYPTVPILWEFRNGTRYSGFTFDAPASDTDADWRAAWLHILTYIQEA